MLETHDKRAILPRDHPFDFLIISYTALDPDEFRVWVTDETAAVFAVNTRRVEKPACVYGLGLLEMIAHGIIPPQPVEGIAFAVDFESWEFAHFLNALEQVKGHHEWPLPI